VKQQVRTLSSPTACNTEQDHRRLEVRLDRGILHGNAVLQPKSKDTSSPFTTAPQSTTAYGILHRDRRSATLHRKSMLARERVSEKGCAHYGSTAEPRVDAEPQSKMSRRCGRRVRVQPRRAAAVRLDPLVKQIRTTAALRRRSRRISSILRAPDTPPPCACARYEYELPSRRRLAYLASGLGMGRVG